MRNKIKKIWNVVSTVLVAIVVIMAVLLVGARVIGLQIFTVLSGSMEPELHTGSLIYVKEVDPAELEVKDIITFRMGDMVATHRIIEILPDENDPAALRFRTKGDANDVEDGGSVPQSSIIGQPVFTLPYMGYVANYIQSPPGTYVAIGAGVALLILVFLPDILFPDDKKGKKVSEGAQPDESDGQ